MLMSLSYIDEILCRFQQRVGSNKTIKSNKDLRNVLHNLILAGKLLPMFRTVGDL